MRILVFSPSYPPVRCGVGEYTSCLAAALTNAGHVVSVVASPPAPASCGSPRVRPIMPDWRLTDFVRAWPELVRWRPDLVVGGFPAVMPGRYHRALHLVPALSKLTLGRPQTVFIVHEFTIAGAPERRALGVALRASDRIITVSERERDAIVAHYPPSIGRRVEVVQIPSNIPDAQADEASDARLRAELAQAGRPLLGYFGLLPSADKGFDELLEAVALGCAALVVTGTLDPDGNAYHAEIAARIERLGVGERVRWLGYLDADAVGRLLHAVDVVVLPFRAGSAGQSGSLLAALVNGAAVVTTRGFATPAWLRDEANALLVAPQDPAALAAAVQRLADEPALAARLRAGARELRFDWESVAAAVTAPRRARSRRGRRSGRLLKRQER